MGLAARGARETDQGRRLLDDVREIEFFRRRAQRIYLKTFLATLAVLLAGRAWLYWRG